MLNKMEQSNRNIISEQMNLIFKAGMNWRDLATWIGAYIVNEFSGLGDQEAVRQRLYRIPMEFSTSLRLFFGEEISQYADRYATLFSEYINLLEYLIHALKNGDDAAVNEYMEQIHHNIHYRSEILSEILPFWQESEWRSLSFRYLFLIVDEVNAFLSGDFLKGTEIFDTLLSQAGLMGDYYSNGLYYQLTS